MLILLMCFHLCTYCCCLFTLVVLLFIFHSCLPCVVVVYLTVVLMATMLLCWRMVRYISCSVVLSYFTVISLLGLHQKLEAGMALEQDSV